MASPAVAYPLALSSPTSPTPGGASLRPSAVLMAIRRRNALVPLPLLPPVPRNAIVTSVRIVHNPSPPSPTTVSPPSSPESPGEESSDDSTRLVTLVDPSDRKSPPSPTSPTSTGNNANFYFSPTTSSPKRSRTRRRSGSRSPRSPPTSPTSCRSQQHQAFPPPPHITPVVEEEEVVVKKDVPLLHAPRQPRSTIVVTVRLANPPPSALPIANDTLSSHPPPLPSSTSTTANGTPPVQTLRQKKALSPLSMRKPRLLQLQSRPSQPPSSSPSLPAIRRPPGAPLPPRPGSYTPGTGIPSADKHHIHQYQYPPPPPVPPKPKWNKPRVSSGLVTALPVAATWWEEEVDEGEGEEMIGLEDALTMDVDMDLYPRLPPILRNPTAPPLQPHSPGSSPGPSGRSPRGKKNKKAKTGSRIALLRWALLNYSGPEVGRRIQAMGVRLAKEIWEAEHAEEVMFLGQGSERRMSGSEVGGDVVGGERIDVGERVGDRVGDLVGGEDGDDDGMEMHPDVIVDPVLRLEREKIVEECIRELEEMEVDLDVIPNNDNGDEDEDDDSSDQGRGQGDGDVEMDVEMDDSSPGDQQDVIPLVSTEMMDEEVPGKPEPTPEPESDIAEEVIDAPIQNANTAHDDDTDTEMEMEPPSPTVVYTPTTTSPPTQPTLSPAPARAATLPTAATTPSPSPLKATTHRRSSLQDKLSELNCSYTRRHSMGEEKLPLVIAAKKWFGKAVL